jgi:hypothetical protein
MRCMLTGEAKKRYQKEYLRRRRAEQRAEEVECCSFCGTADEVHTLVAAPEEAPFPASICDVCAGYAFHTAAERRRFGSTND